MQMTVQCQIPTIAHQVDARQGYEDGSLLQCFLVSSPAVPLPSAPPCSSNQKFCRQFPGATVSLRSFSLGWYETMDAEEFQVFAGMVTQVRQALDKRHALLH